MPFLIYCQNFYRKLYYPYFAELRLTKIPQKKTSTVCGHLHSLPLYLDILVWSGLAVEKILNNETENDLTI